MHYVIIDIETTGGTPKSSKITEIAIYKHDGTDIIDHYETLIDPEMLIPEFIVNLTGISDKMVRNAPKFFEVAKKILEFTEGCVFVAHNVNYDYGIVRQEFRKLGFDFRRQYLCTVIASRKILPGFESYSLGKLSRSLGVELIGRHRAGGDAFATAKIFTLLMQKDAIDLKNHIQDDLNPQILHPNLDVAELDEIPDKTGIYKFYNEFNRLIFVGKSKFIRRRIEQHLKNSKSVKGAKLIKEITRIEYEITGSEFISILVEMNLVNKYTPSFNPPLKKLKFSHGIYTYFDERGYQRLFIGVTSKFINQPLVGFSSKKEAITFLEEKIVEFELCQKLCDLFPTNSSCFHYSINECKGACIQQESIDFYNIRSKDMIKNISTISENYYILENGRHKGEKSIVLFEQGVLRGYGYVPFHAQFSPMEKWRNQIDHLVESEGVDILLIQYIRSKPTLHIVNF